MEKSSIFTTVTALLIFVFILGCGKDEESKGKMKSPLAQEFSATVVTKSGGQSVSMKIYMKPDKYRTDHKAAGTSTIIRKDLNKIWTVTNAPKTYMEMEGISDNQTQQTVAEKIKGEVSRKEIGDETVNGHPTKKYEITATTDDKAMQVNQWWATDINFPIKTAAVDGSWSTEYRDINIGSQADSLFEIPSGFKKMAIPGLPAGLKIPGVNTK